MDKTASTEQITEQKEQLVKLLNHQFGKQVSEIVADWLINNGVAVPLRCKDCRLHECGCPLDTHPYMTPDDGFCYLGKRK